jgi:ankyrin repeat protein
MSTMSTPESTATSNVQGLEICLPAIDVEDSHFQLPIRRHPRIASNIVKDTVINQGYAPGDMNNDSIDKSDSDASQVILTPEAGLSEEELELHSTKEIVTGNDRPMDPENLKEFYDAVARGDVELVKNYIDLGVSVSLKTTEGYTPLVIAILGAQLETARFLLEHGASVHQRANGVPPIVYVSMTAAPAPRFLKLLLDYGASPNTVHGPQHYNALHWAAHVGNIDAVDFLVSTGTDIEQTCSQGRTPLLIAATNGNTGVAKVLLAKGAEINHRSLNGATALGWAACHGHVDIARYLLGEGLNVDNRDNSGISKCHNCYPSLHTNE